VRPDETVAAVGGKGTTSAPAEFIPTFGSYSVTFIGKYPAAITPDRRIVTSTARSSAFGVTSAFVSSASKTHIEVTVFVWKSSTLEALPAEVFVTISYGR
jgi:hypothetical protein